MPRDTTDQRLVELAQGVLVEEDVLGIVRRIMEYNPNLRVQYLDPKSFPELTDAPYRIMEHCPDGHDRLVFSTFTLDERVMERLYRADTQRHDVLANLDKTNTRVREGMKQRFRDEQEELTQLAMSVVRSPKDTYTAVNPLTGFKHTFRSLPHSED